jgi:hypothetical protein
MLLVMLPVSSITTVANGFYSAPPLVDNAIGKIPAKQPQQLTKPVEV